MNVLSLFDGISCGQIALERAGIKVNKYYASEIDKYAIQVTQYNYPNTIQLGDVTKWKEWDIDWKSIDLIIGGSPCQSFSKVGNGTGFDGKSGLFFEFANIRNNVLKYNPNAYFLLENVVMKKEWLNIITEIMRVNPILIDSALVSAQRRKRLYWTNIPNIVQPKDKGIKLKDVLEELPLKAVPKWLFGKFGNRYRYNNANFIDADKAMTISTKLAHPCYYIINNDLTGQRTYTQNEAEKLQTLPMGYTANLSKNRAINAIGNGWTVDVIAHIFKHIIN